jgi:hypothetical protein
MTVITPFQVDSAAPSKRSLTRKPPQFPFGTSATEARPKRQILRRLWPWMVVGLGLLIVLVTGDPLLALVLPFLIVGGLALVALPFETVLPLGMVTLLIFNASAALPHNGFAWFWPPDEIGEILFKNLPLKFAPSDLILAVLLVRALLKLASSQPPRLWHGRSMALGPAEVSPICCGRFVRCCGFHCLRCLQGLLLRRPTGSRRSRRP